MRNIVSISLPELIIKKLTKVAKKEETSRSEIIKRSLSRYFLAHDLAKAKNRKLP